MEPEATITADILSGKHKAYSLPTTIIRHYLMFYGADIPLFQGPIVVETHGSSAWARSYKISVQSTNGDNDTYFMKVRILLGIDGALGQHIGLVGS